jgi:hypothetical protein
MEGRGPAAAAASTANRTASGVRSGAAAREDQASSRKTTTANTTAFSAAEGGNRGQASFTAAIFGIFLPVWSSLKLYIFYHQVFFVNENFKGTVA